MGPEALSQTRDSLINRLKDLEDQESWQVFFDLYRRFIYGVARGAGLSEDEAGEVLQETVITVARNIHQYRKQPGKGSFKSWLMHTTRWRIMDQFRKRKRAQHWGAQGPEATSSTAWIERVPDDSLCQLEAGWDREWESNLLQVALERVRERVDPERYQMFDLHVLKGWPVQRVVETLGATAGQIYAAKYKVSELLQQQVELVKKRAE